MLETIQQYARDRLLEYGEGKAIRNRHLDYYLKFAQEAEPKLHGPDQDEWLDRLERDHDNLRTALEWSRGEGRVLKGSRLVGALLWFWHIRGYWHEGREQAEKLLTQPGATAKDVIRANGLLVAGILTSDWFLVDISANRRYLEELVLIARDLGESGKRFLALALCYLSDRTFGDNPDLAASMMDESLAIARSLDEQWLVAHVIWLKAEFLSARRNFSGMRELCEESLKICQAIGDKRGTAESLWRLGQVSSREHDFARARRELEQSLLCFRELGDQRNIFSALTLLGEIERADHRYDKAKGYYLECLELSRVLGSTLSVIITLSNLGFVFLHDGRLDSAKSFFAESFALSRETNVASVALDILGFAAVMVVEKNAREAVSLFSAYQTFVESGDVRTLGHADVGEYARYLALARDQLDEAKFNTAWEEGRKMTLEQMIAIAEQEIAKSPPASAHALPHDPNALTPREIEVLRLVAAGLSDAQVAAELVISRRTVSTHLTAIYDKLGVNSRTAAVRHAQDHHLI